MARTNKKYKWKRPSSRRYDTSATYDNKQLLKYKCGYCEEEFKMWVGEYSTGEHTISTQVVCPGCGNFLKTEEGK
jgi:DNA-directed RNA polymerase subunit RPC12/RpoP